MTLTSWNSAEDKGFGQAAGWGWGNSHPPHRLQPQRPGRAVDAATAVVAMTCPAPALWQLQLPVHVLPVRGRGEKLK